MYEWGENAVKKPSPSFISNRSINFFFFKFVSLTFIFTYNSLNKELFTILVIDSVGAFHFLHLIGFLGFGSQRWLLKVSMKIENMPCSWCSIISWSGGDLDEWVPIARTCPED